MGQLLTIAYLFTIFMFIFLVAYVLWRIIWFRNYGGNSHHFILSYLVEIPIDRNFNIQEIN